MRAAQRLRQRQSVLRVADIAPGTSQAHRGAGAWGGADNALSSLDLIATTPGGWQTADGDVRLTSDGVPVCMHDATGARTTDNSSAISAITAATFTAAHMLNFPYGNGLGIGTENPPTFAQWLVKVKALNLVGTIEAKVSGAVASIIAAIQAADMGDQMVVLSFTGTDLAAVKAAGIKTGLAQDGTTNIGAAAILTSVSGGPPDYVLYDFTRPDIFTASWIGTLAAAGVKFAPFTMTRRIERVAEVARVQAAGGIVAWSYGNAPGWMASAYSPLNTDPFANATDTFLRGVIPSSLSTVQPAVVGGKLKFAHTSSQWAHQGWGSRDAAWSRLDVTVTYDQLDADTARWAGIAFGLPDDRDWHDHQPATNLGQGYGVFLRQSGNFGLFRHNADGVAATQIATAISTPAISAGQSVPIRIEFLAANVIKATRVDTGHSLSATDATIRGGHFHFGKNLAPGGGTNGAGQYSFSAVTVTP